jgi:hypothetical protein
VVAVVCEAAEAPRAREWMLAGRKRGWIAVGGMHRGETRGRIGCAPSRRSIAPLTLRSTEHLPTTTPPTMDDALRRTNDRRTPLVNSCSSLSSCVHTAKRAAAHKCSPSLG